MPPSIVYPVEDVSQIERVLLDEMNRARKAHELAQEGIQQDHGYASGATLLVWMKSLREYSDFVQYRIIPGRFKGQE